MADESGETGYDTYPPKDEMDLLSWSTIRVLGEMGVARPTNFPKELIDEEGDVDWELVDENPTPIWSTKSTNRSPMSMAFTSAMSMS